MAKEISIDLERLEVVVDKFHPQNEHQRILHIAAQAYLLQQKANIANTVVKEEKEFTTTYSRIGNRYKDFNRPKH